MSICNFTQLIDSSECVGDSLVKINNNFTTLDEIVCTLVGASPTIANIRLSLDPTTPTPTTDRIGVNASVLYIHPYKGTSISLYNVSTRRWEINQVTAVLPFPLTGLAANTSFDVYLYRDANSVYRTEFIAWGNNNPGGAGPVRTYRDGVAVKSNGEPNKRLVGCIRTIGTPGQSEQSFGTIVFGGAHPKQFIWNAQNIIPVSVQNFESGSWTYNTAGWNIVVVARRVGSTNVKDTLYYTQESGGFGVGNPHPIGTANWRRTHQETANATDPDGRNNRFSFIIGEPTLVNMTYQGYINTGGIGYVGIGLNNDNSPTFNGFQLIGELNGDSQTPRSTYQQSLLPGYHYLQTFDVGSVTGIIWGEHHGCETGFLASVYN